MLIVVYGYTHEAYAQDSSLNKRIEKICHTTGAEHFRYQSWNFLSKWQIIRKYPRNLFGKMDKYLNTHY